METQTKKTEQLHIGITYVEEISHTYYTLGIRDLAPFYIFKGTIWSAGHPEHFAK
ncbi:hypothetical protein Sjap_022631 [Stephania japonica]|uniref:Uncharacterized protein n=1 Tax=Stephania japonica TaxID=461633 RepID=A0AAP0EY29_9MAGN